MDINHTPGPWIAQLHFRQRDGAREYAMVTANGHLVPLAGVLLRVDNYDDGHGEANARLIAAAPEMLEACREAALLLDNIRESTPASIVDTVRDKCRAAVKAAAGASNGEPRD